VVNIPSSSTRVGRSACGLARVVLIVFFSVQCLYPILLVSSTCADEAADLAFIWKVNPITPLEPQQVVRVNPEASSELKLAAIGLIRLYQKFISSQDAPTCNFVPTCSRFGMAGILEYGMARGLLLTADRLLRCNGSQSKPYPRDDVSGKYIDPVSDYAALK
jgi:putative membrane protein insertion efficiency factor